MRDVTGLGGLGKARQISRAPAASRGDRHPATGPLCADMEPRVQKGRIGAVLSNLRKHARPASGFAVTSRSGTPAIANLDGRRNI